ncbi:hypothetical protein AAMO2058_000531700 [Amorphochlora amoebiformis]
MVYNVVITEKTGKAVFKGDRFEKPKYTRRVQAPSRASTREYLLSRLTLTPSLKKVYYEQRRKSNPINAKRVSLTQTKNETVTCTEERFISPKGTIRIRRDITSTTTLTTRTDMVIPPEDPRMMKSSSSTTKTSNGGIVSRTGSIVSSSGDIHWPCEEAGGLDVDHLDPELRPQDVLLRVAENILTRSCDDEIKVEKDGTVRLLAPQDLFLTIGRHFEQMYRRSIPAGRERKKKIPKNLSNNSNGKEVIITLDDFLEEDEKEQTLNEELLENTENKIQIENLRLSQHKEKTENKKRNRKQRENRKSTESKKETPHIDQNPGMTSQVHSFLSKYAHQKDIDSTHIKAKDVISLPFTPDTTASEGPHPVRMLCDYPKDQVPLVAAQRYNILLRIFAQKTIDYLQTCTLKEPDPDTKTKQFVHNSTSMEHQPVIILKGVRVSFKRLCAWISSAKVFIDYNERLYNTLIRSVDISANPVFNLRRGKGKCVRSSPRLKKQMKEKIACLRDEVKETFHQAAKEVVQVLKSYVLFSNMTKANSFEGTIYPKTFKKELSMEIEKELDRATHELVQCMADDLYDVSHVIGWKKYKRMLAIKVLRHLVEISVRRGLEHANPKNHTPTAEDISACLSSAKRRLLSVVHDTKDFDVIGTIQSGKRAECFKLFDTVIEIITARDAWEIDQQFTTLLRNTSNPNSARQILEKCLNLSKSLGRNNAKWCMSGVGGITQENKELCSLMRRFEKYVVVQEEEEERVNRGLGTI